MDLNKPLILKYNIENDQYQNVKEVLKAYFKVSDRLLLKLKKNNKILVNGKIVSPHFPLSLNDIIEVCLDLEEDN